MILGLSVWAFVRALLGNSAAVSLENVVLRHQLAVLQRSVGRPRLRRRDRLFWGGLSQLWAGRGGHPLIFYPPNRLPPDPPTFPPFLRREVPRPLVGGPPPRLLPPPPLPPQAP